jgi:hypothetical protein
MSINITSGKARTIPFTVTLSNGQTDTSTPASVGFAPADPNIVARIDPTNPRVLGVYAKGTAVGNGNGVGINVGVGGRTFTQVVFGVAPTVSSIQEGTPGDEIDPPDYLLT